MKTLTEAQNIVCQQQTDLTIEQVSLTAGFNRVLAQDLTSHVSMPPFDKSAMDGYACRKDDIGLTLEIIEHIPAGAFPQKEIKPGQCASIMTGAPIPAGANMVVMKEHVVVENGKVKVDEGKRHKTNICYQGEDVKTGDVVLKKGAVLLPAHLAMAASAGYSMVPVYAKLKVGVVATGSEIVEPGYPLEKAQIYNSNAYQLMGQLSRIGIDAVYMGIVPDDEMLLTQTLRLAKEKYDVVILTGGVSVGDHDLLPVLLQKDHYDILFDAVAIKPGKPVCFAKKDKHYVCGLSGNPVSSFFQFEFIALALIQQLSGASFTELGQPMKAAVEISVKEANRTQFLPLTLLADGSVEPIEFHGSAHLHALTNAKAIAVIPPLTTTILKNEWVYVRFL